MSNKPSIKRSMADLESAYATKKGELEQAAPPQRRYIVQDATTEKLCELFRGNPNGLLQFRDELAGFFSLLEKPGREGDRELYLETWDGDRPYVQDRVGRGSVHIEAMTLSLVGGIQPGKLKRYVSEAQDGAMGDDGMIQRLQVTVWPDDIGEWVEAQNPPNKEARERAYQIFKWLDGLSKLLPADTKDARGVGVVYFDDAAQGVYDDWRRQLENRLRGKELADTPSLEAHLSKYRSLMPSLALVFHLIDLAARKAPIVGNVGLVSAQKAAAWCEFLEQHARKIYADEVAPGIDAAHKLAEKIGAGMVRDGDTVRDITRKEWAGLTKPSIVRAGLDVLEASGWVQIQLTRSENVVRPGETGGRAKQVVRLHPDFGGVQ